MLGGREEGWSQVQRYSDDWDGALMGPPAFRWAQQQVNHAFSAVAQQTVGYVPPSCVLEAMVSWTIEACDRLDGRENSSRVDLCTLAFNVTELVGTNYPCEASRGAPAQSSEVTKEDVELAQTFYSGLRDSDGRRAYFHFTPTSDFGEAPSSSCINDLNDFIT